MIGALAQLTLVVVDVETTGWLHEQAEMTEIGAVRLTGGQLTGEFSSLVRPAGPIPAEITALTGITDQMVSQAPQAAQALRAFLAFAGDCVLVAHNAPFDLGFLTAAATAGGISWPPMAVLDTAVLARLLLGPDDVPDCRLATLAAYFAAATSRATGPWRMRGPPPMCWRACSASPPGCGLKPRPRWSASPADEHAGLVPAFGQGRETTGVRYCRGRGARSRQCWRQAVVTAIVLIKADVASIPETAEAIAQLPAVTEVYSVTGEFDLVAIVRVRAHEELGDVIPGTLNKVTGVTHTETHIAFRTYSRHDLEAAFSIGYTEA